MGLLLTLTLIRREHSNRIGKGSVGVKILASGEESMIKPGADGRV